MGNMKADCLVECIFDTYPPLVSGRQLATAVNELDYGL